MSAGAIAVLASLLLGSCAAAAGILLEAERYGVMAGGLVLASTTSAFWIVLRGPRTAR